MKKYALILALAICVGVGGWFALRQDTPPVEETITETINEETPEITADSVDTEETTETETETPVEETPVVEDANNNDAGFDVSKYESVFQEIFDANDWEGLSREYTLDLELSDVDMYKEFRELPPTCTHDDYIQWRNEMLGGSQSSNTPSQPSNNESKPSNNTSSSKPSSTTDPELRVSMLGHRRAGESIDVMRRLAKHGIEMNCQVVACPGINDGEALLKTLYDLAEMEVSSVAIVPVGITKYREGLTEIQPYTKEQAASVIDLVEDFAKEHMARKGTSFAWCSDEFYLVAEYPLPEKSYYEDMTQLENGVGMLRLLLAQAAYALEDMEEANPVPFTVATGVLAAPFIEEILALAKKACPQVEGKVVAIRNEFFGETITVSGLITGQDLVKQLTGMDLGERVLIPSNMLRTGEQVFLDDMTLEELEKALGCRIEVVDAESGYDLADAMLGLPHETGSVSYAVEDDEYYRYNP